MGSGNSQVVGYRYYVGMHQVYSLSPYSAPVTAVKKIKVGEKEAWTGSVSANTQLDINQPDLFGGDAKEGGIVGLVDVEFGSAAQSVNSYLAAKLTGYPLPAFRGILGLVLRSPQVSALNPYIKPWSMYASRINGGFYPAKATIGDSMNPAHIIYELLTLPEFNIGAAPSDIDIASFTAAADTLYAEGFGLSFFWEDERPTEEFIDYIRQHIDGTLYPNPSTGQLTLKLVRDDFTLASLPILDSSNVLRIDQFSQPLPGELASVVQVRFEDQATGEAGSVMEHDIAVLEMQGGSSVPVVRDYQGIPDATLASKVALRELRQLATPLARGEILCNRNVWNLNIGSPFRLQWPPLGIADMVMRVVDVDYGTLTDGRITLSVVQDVFRVADTVIGAPTASGWASPISSPAAAPSRLAIEAPYWVVAREVVGDQNVLLTNIDPASGLLLAAGNRPSSDAYDYLLYSRTGAAAYAKRSTGAFAPTAILTAAVGRADTVFPLGSGVDVDLVEPGSWAHIDGELVKIVSISATSATVARGVLDTVPVPHAAGVTLYFADDFKAIDPTEWSSGQVVNAKLLTRTGLGTLLEASAPADSVTMNHRFIRPYAPGKVQVNAVAYPASATGDLTITWAHRDRTLQTAYIVEQSEASIGPEVGTTYNVRIYNAQTGGTLIHSYTGLTGTSQAYTVAQSIIDNGSQPANLRVEIESVRDGYTSWQTHTVPFAWV